MLGKHSKTWVVVADGMHARVLQWEGGDRFTAPLGEELYNAEAHGFSRDLKSDAPGRGMVPGSGAHHGMQPPHDPHELAKERFERHVAQILDEAASRKEFDRLILVAPPKALGVLRQSLADRVRRCVTGEINKDLVHVATGDLASHLGAVLKP